MSTITAATRCARNGADETTVLARTTEALIALGYFPGAPRHVSANCLAIDRQVAAESVCEECGHKGLGYHPWQRGRSYVAVAFCANCGSAEEF